MFFAEIPNTLLLSCSYQNPVSTCNCFFGNNGNRIAKTGLSGAIVSISLCEKSIAAEMRLIKLVSSIFFSILGRLKIWGADLGKENGLYILCRNYLLQIQKKSYFCSLKYFKLQMKTKYSNTDINFNKNRNAYRELMRQLNAKLDTVKKGGGEKSTAKHKAKGKMTARERIKMLIDEGSDFWEIGAFAADGMYEEQGGCPSAGVVCGIGLVEGRRVMIVANDATVKAGAWFPMAGKKNLRAQEICMENHLPIIYLVDSAGVFLPDAGRFSLIKSVWTYF